MGTIPPEIYPRNRFQLARALLFVAAVLLAGLLGLGAAKHSSKRQVIRSKDLQEIVQQLGSFSAEAGQLSYQYIHNRATSTYTDAYADTLRQTSDSLSNDLMTHTIDPSIAPQANSTKQLAGQMSQALQHITAAPSKAGLSGLPALFARISQRLQAIGNTL